MECKQMVLSDMWNKRNSISMNYFQHQSALLKSFPRINLRNFIHSDHFYSASSSPLLLRSASDTAVLCRSFTKKRHRQLRVKDLPKVPTWRLERDTNPRPSG